MFSFSMFCRHPVTCISRYLKQIFPNLPKHSQTLECSSTQYLVSLSPQEFNDGRRGNGRRGPPLGT